MFEAVPTGLHHCPAEGVLPILNACLQDGEVSYNYKMFVTLEQSPLTMANVAGMHYLMADKYGHGLVSIGTDGSFQGRQLDLGYHEGYVSYPSAACMNGAGDVYVADRGNNRVQVFATQR